MKPLTIATPAQAFEHGLFALSERRVESAIRAFDSAEQQGYDAVECASRRWQCWMLLGRFEEAWRESDLIASRGASNPYGLWDGRPFAGKRVVIRCLHGYGDAIQFLRYAALVRESASRVIVETHPEMVSLLERLPFVHQVITWGSGALLPREAWDQQVEVTELPRAFRTTLAAIPATIPYFQISVEARRQSRLRLAYSPGLKVGLVWASSMWNPARCIRLSELEPILDCGNCSFYSFQRGAPRDEIHTLSAPVSRIHDTSEHSPEIVDTAADLLHMDLLITVDTMAAHLAGALGKRVWTLLPYEADWRWMMDREDTPWYPSMRLFRQSSRGDWGPVVRCVAGELGNVTARWPRRPDQCETDHFH